MPIREVQREFNMTYAELEEVTWDLCDHLNRDMSDMAVFGMTTNLVVSLASLCSDFGALKTDEEWAGEILVKTGEKDSLAEQLREQIRFMMARVNAAFGEDSDEYNAFKFSDFQLLTDVELYEYSYRIIDFAENNYLAELAVFGLSSGVILAYKQLAEDFKLSTREQSQTMDARNLETINRIKKANELYEKVSAYSAFGKKLYAKSNPAKYEEYLMYTGGPTGLPGKIQSLVYNGSLSKFIWQPDTKATSYEVQTSPDGSEWLQIYEGPSPEAPVSQLPGEGQARCRGINETGSGSWSDILNYSVPVPVPHIVSVGFDSGNNRSIVTFDTVAYADLYLIYQSVVPIGNPAGYFDEIGTPVSSPFNTVSANNAMREYYYVKASYNDVLSEQSNIVFLDVPVA